VIPALGRLKQKNHEFKAILSYIVRPYLKHKKKERFTLAHGFRELAWVTCSGFWACGGRSIAAGECVCVGGGSLSTLWWPGSKKREEAGAVGLQEHIPRGQLPLTRPHLLKVLHQTTSPQAHGSFR
jgi:hypothetical protein